MAGTTSTVIGTRRFLLEDQRLFADLAGDANPIHMDPAAARRSVVGDAVVHGMHLVLWALERLALSPIPAGPLSHVSVSFLKAVFLDEEVSLSVQGESAGEIRLDLAVGTKKAASIRLRCQPLPEDTGPARDEALRPATAPLEIAFADMAAQQGEVPFAATGERFAAAFPAASACFGAAALRELAACSRLVGMCCPGLRSVFSRLSLEWYGRGPTAPLRYRVSGVDPRFSLVRIAVQGAAVSGSIEAFSPPPPPAQLGMADLAQRIGPEAFATQTALVVGGSRGLGELTAKTIAAGGGKVVLTYAVGRAEAERVAEEIRQFGGQARCLPYDVTQPAAPQLDALGADRPSHVYYYATCQIFRANTAAFDLARLERFQRFYLHGFLELCQALRDGGTTRLSCFYPSSTAIDERPAGLTEYAMAKAAGEILAADLGRLFPGYRAHQLRLPRLLTDQTAVVLPQNLPRAIDVLLPVLQAMGED